MHNGHETIPSLMISLDVTTGEWTMHLWSHLVREHNLKPLFMVASDEYVGLLALLSVPLGTTMLQMKEDDSRLLRIRSHLAEIKKLSQDLVETAAGVVESENGQP